MRLVCRPLLMYNEYVPAIAGKRTWKYQVLGHHDGMDVLEAIYMDIAELYQKLYNEYMQRDQDLDYADQAYYGLHDDDGREEAFWDRKSIFTFVSFIQFRGKKISEYNKYLESEAHLEPKNDQKNDQVSIRAYYSLDYNDSILVVKCDRYETGMRFINNLHQGMSSQQPFEISNSYSVLAFEKGLILDTNCSQLSSEIINKVELRIVERYQGSVSLLYSKLQDKLKNVGGIILSRYALLGTDDEAIVIKKIPCDTFLKLYAEGSGILCNANEEAQKYASAITTKIMYAQDKYVGSEREDRDGQKEFCDALSRYIKHCYGNKKSMSEIAEKKTLIKIVNALGKIEYARNMEGDIIEYNFFTLFLPFYFFIQLHIKAEDRSNEYYEFLTYFNICTQNYDKPDRVFLQTADFNMRYFEMQTKFFTLYSAYIYRLKQLLNGASSNRYEFVLYPGMSEKTEVVEFHKKESDQYRLCKVAIAETGMYNIKPMLCILGHEVAHYVGTDIRSRKNRYERLLRISSRAIVMEFQFYFEKYELITGSCSQEMWQEYEDNFAGWIEQYIDRTSNDKYWKQQADFGDETEEVIGEYIKQAVEYRDYTENMKDAFVKAIKDMLRLQGTEIFGEVIWRYLDERFKNGEIEYGDRSSWIKKYNRFLNKVIDSFTEESMDATNAFHIGRVLDVVLYLLRECYADLISILSLKMRLKDYLSTLTKEMLNVGYNIESIQDTMIIARIAIVTVVMHHRDNMSDTYFIWDDEELLADEDQCSMIVLQRQVLEFMWTYIGNDTSLESSGMVLDCGNVIFDNKILLEIISYLLHCRAQFYKHVDEAGLEVIAEFKRVAECDNVDEFYTTLMKLITEYEQDIYSELTETAQRIRERTEGKADGVHKDK